MAVHLLRDYFTQNLTNATTRKFIISYILILFLRRVLGYSHVGSTNYPINNIGTLLIATGDTNPTGIASFPVGNKAGINLGTQKEFFVTIPASVRAVVGTDIGRILVLKSTANPRFNSGVFVIVGIDLASNSYVIDYRTLGDTPPVEAADSIQWWLYEKDTNCPVQGGPNTKAAGSYRSDGDSPTPRIILQSPHATGWQVRLCVESTSDVSTDGNNAGANCPSQTASPGFGGSSSGDFPTFGQHFHAPMWYNSNSRSYAGGAPGYGDIFNTASVQLRITVVGDDTGQGVILYGRRQFNAIDPMSSILCFGIPENEPSPLPVNNIARLFVLGTGHHAGFGLAQARYSNDGGLNASRLAQFGVASDTYGPSQGMSATPFGTPCMCAASMWAFISSGNGQATGPHLNFFATDNPYTSSSDLLPIDVMQATLHTWSDTAISEEPVYPYAPRSMGTIPHIRLGRENFGDFSPTTDFARSYQHLRRGLYVPWLGPNIIP